MDGTYRTPVAAGTEITTTELQQSVFSAPPSSLPASIHAPETSLKPSEVADTNDGVNFDREEGASKGVKRGRPEESDDEEAPMEEDSDAPMEASSDEDDD